MLVKKQKRETKKHNPLPYDDDDNEHSNRHHQLDDVDMRYRENMIFFCNTTTDLMIIMIRYHLLI